MFCPSCGVAAEPGNKFCTECGASMAGMSAHPASDPAVTAPNPAVKPAVNPAVNPAVDPAVDPGFNPSVTPVQGTPAGAQLPPPTVAPAAAASPLGTPPPADDLYAATATLSVVEQTSHSAFVPSPSWDAGPTGAWPVHTTDESPVVAVTQPFHLTPLLIVATLAAIVGAAAAFTQFVSYDVTGDQVHSESAKINDLASNLTVGVCIAAVLLLAGAVLGATGRRIGSGLAGGAGLALGGALSLGVARGIATLDSVQLVYLNSGGNFTLTTTQEIGFVLAIAGAALGGIAFLVSLRDAGADGLARIHPLIGAFGAVGALAVMVGPLIPTHGAKFGQNFSVETIPPATLYLRLLSLLLIGIAGVVGLLVNRKWGIGVALGGVSVAVWQWATSITKSGDHPFGIGGGNPGDQPGHYTPHAVTTLGIVVVLVAIVGALLSLAQRTRASS